MLSGQGLPRLDAIGQIGVTEQTCDRWKTGASLRHRSELGAASDLTPDKSIQTEAATGNV